MMELDDSEFDAAFRRRVFDADPQFEEAAWNKMEGKLKRRERIVLFRKATLVLSLLLLTGLIGYYSFDKKAAKKAIPELAGTEEQLKGRGADLLPADTSRPGNNGLGERIKPAGNVHGVHKGTKTVVDHYATVVKKKNEYQEAHPDTKEELVAGNSVAGLSRNPADLPQGDFNLAMEMGAQERSNLSVQKNTMVSNQKKVNFKKRVPMSLALSAGPEFNSAATVIGGKSGFSAGLTFSVGIARNFRLQTGLKYSAKDYATDSFAYRIRNPKIQGMVSGIDASCTVLEIPVIVSYTVMEDSQRSIDLNLGLSSYLMLKEDYTFKYTAASGIPNRLIESRNANQHLMSVVDLSATYFIKLKTEKFKIGLEPFVKIPLTGVGEGAVNLKSSGISLKIRYDLNK